MNIMKKGRQQSRINISSTIGCLLLVLLLLPSFHVAAQKYNFINLNVENGLAQSQVTVFAQNKNNELLIGTYGGLSVFDGTNFVNYNKGNGLLQNLIKAISCDHQHNIWIGTNNGISRYDGKSFKTFYPSAKPEENAVDQIETDVYRNVWAFVSGALYRFDGKQFRKERPLDTITAITLDKSGKLWAVSHSKGIYVFNGKQWDKEIDFSGDHTLYIQKIIFGTYSGTLYTYGNKGIQVSDKGKLKSPDWIKTFPAKGFLNKILEDSKGNIWLSVTDGGAWVYSQQNWIHYTYQNGLTDDNVNTFYEDTEGNIWIGTNGSGIFRYTGSIFTYYDRASGLASPSVMSIAQNKKGDLFLASSSAGLYQLVNGTPKRIDMPAFANRINSIVTDSSGMLWIGTDQAVLWNYDGRKAKIYEPSIKQSIFSISNLYYHANAIWISSQTGLFRLQGDSLSRENVLRTQVYSTCNMGQDSLLVGTLKGAYVYRTDLRKLIPKPLVENSTTLCFETDIRHVYIGTDDKGVLVWDRNTKKFTVINHKSGLTCDYIYSLLKDRDGNIWVGTGCGIDKITFKEDGSFYIRSFGSSDGLLGVESNANASFEDREGYLWFGTTKGVFRYNPYITAAKQQAPKVVLQSVKLFSKDLTEGKYSDSTIPFTGLKWRPVLPPGQNHLTFTFKGIYLSNPEKIKYRYQLIGADKTHTETDQTTVVYPNLPPGEYLFKVWASDADGNWYNNAVTYAFTINAPYYTTWYFRLGLGLLFVAIFLGSVYFRNRQKELRRIWEERLREEEQALVRQKTAEDFHDEIGNKLTRINLLATIAESKLLQPPAEIKKILQQIQQNVTSLYNGSKDIIWSLQPDSDYLDEIVFRIRQNTADLLQDTALKFDYYQDPDMGMHVKLPIDYSRNIIMIFKEAVNNIVKHAAATHIIFSIKQTGNHIVLELQDDGKGFDPQTVSKGNGMGNINNRAKRIGAKLEIQSELNKGTRLTLVFAI
jgi:signal transduction histidine kinase/ligand-binding sensor domain-containing protein